MAARLDAEGWAKARVLWEADPTMSHAGLAKMLGVSKQAVQKHATAEEWKKVSDQGELARRAHDKADAAILEQQKAQPERPQDPPDAPLSDVVADTSVALRAKVIERHRREWDGARNNVYKAIQTNDFEKAKLGKITAEAIKIIQDGERKAWGFDKESDGGTTVVIERISSNVCAD